MHQMPACPRCSHSNESRARFCANCGLNLTAAGRDLPHALPRPPHRSGNWVVLVMVCLGILLGALAVSFRWSRPRQMISPVPVPSISGEPVSSYEQDDVRPVRPRSPQQRRQQLPQYRWRERD